ncbi:MAG TPA: hypothetical protein VE195_10300, partial [Acidobacteriaceae bacterium]|nr:hypothetical protein [Acidobacteriaceae bacterium]
LNFLPFLQLASLSGPWGITFFLLLFSATLAIAWHLRTADPKKALQVVLVGLGSIALVLFFGIARLAMPSRGTPVPAAAQSKPAARSGSAHRRTRTGSLPGRS